MIKIGITMGDPSGVGPAAIIKAMKKVLNLAEFFIIGDEFVLSKVHFPRNLLRKNINIVNVRTVNRKNFAFGRISAEYGEASIRYLDKALSLINSKVISGLVTCPISKESINKAGFKYTGHTEFFSRKTGIKEPVMMLLNESIRFSLVTRHISIKKLPKAITQEKIAHVIRETKRTLIRDFMIHRPKLVVCGLNPHASDNGLLGDEENKIIKPVVNNMRRAGFLIEGPLSADVAIYKALSRDFDAVIAMNHDQALIPLKVTGGRSGVNMTLNLPFVRTSPLHGTAFDIARNPQSVDPQSLIAAINLAIKCVSSQKRA